MLLSYRFAHPYGTARTSCESRPSWGGALV